MSFRTVTATLFLALFATSLHGLSIHVPANSKECFMEYVKTKRTAFLRIAVVESQDLYDIKLSAHGPFQTTPSESQQDMKFFDSMVTTEMKEGSTDVQHNGFNFQTEHRGGWYKFCLGNEHSSYNGKVVDFSTHFGLTKEDELGEEDAWEMNEKEMHIETVKHSLERLTQLLELIQYEQNYYFMREKRHQKTLNSNQSRVFWYTSMEIILLAAVYGVQIHFLNQWFSGSGGLLAGRQWA